MISSIYSNTLLLRQAFRKTSKSAKTVKKDAQKYTRFCITRRDSLKPTFQLSHTTFQVDLDMLYPMDIFLVRLHSPGG